MDDERAISRLFNSCSDYFQIVLGRPPEAADARSLFYEGPEADRPPGDKMLLGFRRPEDDVLIGVLDGFRDYPEPGVWYVGLLLVDPSERKRGLGQAIMEAFAEEAQRHGARELQINIVEQNVVAQRFWTRLGFAETRRWSQRYGSRESIFIRMRRPL